MTRRTECPFCAIVAGQDSAVREVAHNDSVVVFFPTDPAVLGHCMIVPRRHVEHLSDLTSAEVSHVMLAAQTMSKSLRDAFQSEGINMVQSNGEAATQGVPHVHFHILGRRQVTVRRLVHVSRHQELAKQGSHYFALRNRMPTRMGRSSI
ncbi:HIT family protein [Trueperella pyogenes]|uniref:HIT family protein n=1 Tax=Trueperella pyogenes TaxID=1661 RepID=UPI00345CD54C